MRNFKFEISGLLRVGVIVPIVLFIIGGTVWGQDMTIEELQALIDAEGMQWTAGETDYSGWSLEELRSLCGTLVEETGENSPLSVPLIPEELLPSTFDWRDPNGEMGYDGNYVTAVRNQTENCGACWAFADIAVLESDVMIGINAPDWKFNLSEQELISSCGATDTGGCSDDFLWTGGDYLLFDGTPYEWCLPYLATDDPSACSRCAGWASNLYKINSYLKSYYPTKGDLKSYIYTYGPIAVTMRVFRDFQENYDGGVYEKTPGSPEVRGHAVLLIGWDNTKNCFIGKNSWGENWGIDGYFKIGYSQVNKDQPGQEKKVELGRNTLATYEDAIMPHNLWHVRGQVHGVYGPVLPNVDMKVLKMNGTRVQNADIDSQGDYFFMLPNDDYEVSPQQYNNYYFEDPSGNGETFITVGGGNVPDVDFTAYGEHHISGQVVFKDGVNQGQGVPGVTITVKGPIDADHTLMVNNVPVTTDTSGDFIFPYLGNGEYKVDSLVKTPPVLSQHLLTKH